MGLDLELICKKVIQMLHDFEQDVRKKIHSEIDVIKGDGNRHLSQDRKERARFLNSLLQMRPIAISNEVFRVSSKSNGEDPALGVPELMD